MAYLVNTITEFPSFAAKRGIALLTGTEVTNPAAEVARIGLDFAAYGIPLTVGDIDDANPAPVVPIGMAAPNHEHLTDEAFCAMASEHFDGPQVVGAAGAMNPFLVGLLSEVAKRLVAKFGPGILDWLLPTPKPAA